MAITHLGAKRVQGTKVDRTVDSLGSSANGTNTGITLVTNETLKGNADFTENYTTPTHTWTQSGSTVSVTSGVARSNSAGSNNGDRVTAPLGLTLSNTKWTCDFDLITSSSTSSSAPITIQSSTGAFNTSSHDLIGILLDANRIYILHKDGGGAIQTSSLQTISASTQYYCRLTRTSATEVVLKIYTDSARTVQHGSTITQSSLPSTVQGLTTIQHGSYNGGGATSGQTWDIDNVKVYNDSISNTPAKFTGAYSFDGSDYVSTSEDGLDFQVADKFSVAFWFKSAQTSEGGFINRWNSSNVGWLILKDSGTACSFRFSSSWSGSAFRIVSSSNSAFGDDEWHHLAVTYGGGGHATAKIYIDGALDSSSANLTGTVGAITYTTSLEIGDKNGTSQSDKYDGEIDDIGIWKRELTATEISDLVNVTVSSSTTWTQNFSSATPTAWTEDSSGGYADNLEPYKGSVNRLWFDLDDSSSTGVMGMLDLQNASYIGANPNDDKWKMRFKINLEKFDGSSTTSYIGLTDSSSNGSNGSARWAGIALIAGTGIKTVADNSNGALTGSPILGSAIAVSESTDYYVTIERTSSSTLTTTVRTGSHSGSVVGSASTITTMSGTSGLRYWKIQNSRAGNGSQNRGYVYDLEFYNASNDGALVSSLTNKSELKANYTMDSLSLGATELFEVTGSSGTGWTSSGTSINFNSAHSNAIGSTSTSSGDYVTRTISDLTGGATTTLDDEKWVVDFEAYHTGSSNNFNLEFATGTPSYSGSYYALGNFFQDNGSLFYWITTDNNNGSRSESYFPSSPSGRLNDYKGEILYGRMTRLSSTSFKVEAFTDSDRTNSLGSATRTVNASIAGLDRMNVWANAGGGNYYVKNVKVYNGVTSLEGCKNDFSSTSALDAYTNLPVNTIFEQTDDTPSYWFKQSDNSWLWSPIGVKYNLADGNTGWDVQSSSYFYTTGTNELFFKATNEVGDAAYDLGAGNVSDTKWTLRMKVNFSEIGGGNGSNVGFVLSSTDKDGGSDDNQNQLGWAWGEPPTNGGTGSGQNYIGIRNTTTSSGSNAACYPCRGTAGDAVGFYDDGWDDSAEDTDYYIEIKRTSQTDATFTIWTGSYGGTEKVSLSVTNLLDATGLRYLKFMQRQPAESRGGATEGTIKEMIFYNGVVPP